MNRPHAAVLVLAALLVPASAIGAPIEPIAVQVIRVKHMADIRTYSLTGEIAARDSLDASFPTSGRITAMLVSRGDHVKAGQILAQVDSVQQAQSLRAAEAALASASAAETKAKSDAYRQFGLLAKGATTRRARDNAADALRAAEAAVAQAVANLDRARKALADTKLTAPADATVTDKMANVGEVVGDAQPVVQLALGDRYDAVFQVPEAMIAAAPKTPIEVRLSAVDHPVASVTGKVRIISPLVDSRHGTVIVKVAMPSLPTGLRFGDAIIGTISLPDEPHIILPWTAISATVKGPAVWVVDPKTEAVSLRQVNVLRYESERIIVEGGLKDGDEVIGLGSNRIYPGWVVRPVARGVD